LNPESTLTEQEKKVYDLIPTGKENAVPVDYIAQTLAISNRHVIELVRNLRLKSLDIGLILVAIKAMVTINSKI